MVMAMMSAIGFSQVVFQVQAPSTPAGLQGTYPLTWADPSGGDWATPDLNIPANSVTGALEFVDDGDVGTDAYGNPTSQDACNTGSAVGSSTVNASISGKIAVLYRGDCQFGHKAAAVENAGAIACIIINHTGAPVGMAGGDSGNVVTIPVIMISEQDGATLQSAITAGTITQAFIGSKTGLFNNDLGALSGDVLRARRFSNLAPLSTNASEFSVPVGAWIRNIGSQPQSGAELRCEITMGSQIYADTASIPTINSGDSVFVALTPFSQASYANGLYQMTYTIETAGGDEEPSDNVIEANFMISDSLYSYGRLDPTNNDLPMSPAGFRSGNFTTDWEGCLAFDDPNASRVVAEGMTFSATTSSTDVLTNEFIEARVYQWDDVFTDIEDPNLNMANLVQIESAFYIYTADLQDSNLYVPYSAPITLNDNQRYMFCLNSSSQLIFAGYDNKYDYRTTQDDYASGANGAHLQPSIPGSSDATYYLNGFGTDVQIAVSVKFDLAPNSIDEITSDLAVVPFPNPTKDQINITVGDLNGTAVIDLYDVAGKLVVTKDVTLASNTTITVDVSNLDNGSYLGKMTFEDGTVSTFNVVVNK